jgi:molybdopterin/thiamine biosynthesis adenylyltransferase
MEATLALREEQWSALLDALENPQETAGFILAGLAHAPGEEELTLLGRSLQWVPEEHYRHRTGRSLVISSRGYVPALGAAASDQSLPVFVHTHPHMSPTFSARDATVDEALRNVSLLRSRAPFYVSLIVGGTRARPSFSGRVYNGDGFICQVERLRIIGRRLRLLHSHGAADADIDAALFDRQIRAFGEEGQRLLARIHVGVVGAGGTGSATFEQLVRLGFHQITVIDDDRVTRTNVTRIHESGLRDAEKRKVKVMKAAAARIGLGTEVEAITGRITSAEVAQPLRHLDIIFGCTDDERGRYVLSKLAITHLIPVFDMGFAVASDGRGGIRALEGRVTTLLPGAACLLCRRRITPEGLTAEALPPEERARRAAEGYVRGLNQRDPSVGTFTTLVAGLAINELLDRLFAYSEGAAAFGATEVLLRLHDRRLNFNSREPGSQHWCGEVAHYGRGDGSTL